MSVGYVTVQWNRHKRVYDGLVVAAVILYVGMFFFIGRLLFRGRHSISHEVLALRALGSCAYLMLSFVLSIGPLARLEPRFLPLLYNRRHLGVATFLVAMLHGGLAIGYYHGFGGVNPLISLLTTNSNFTSLRAFPFQILGLVALVMLFLMAATSHDFWNRQLSPSLWKALHMMVYPAYALVVMHVVLGAMQTQQRGVVLAVFVAITAAAVAVLHFLAGTREMASDHGRPTALDSTGDEWIDVGPVADVVDNRGKVVCAVGGERLAVFRYGGRVSAVTNVCAHQGGPLGEGKIVDGCITCPWHGWQYRPADGQAPPPFTERIATHPVRISAGRVLVSPIPLPPGTLVEPAIIGEDS